jgi:hypothetical protein
VIVFDTPAPAEIEFREGKRQVPEYIAALLRDIPTHRLTYDEAIEFANRRMEADYINAQRDRVLAAHFRELR